MAKKKISLWMIASIILAILFICSIVYISAGKYRRAKDAEKNEIFQQGAQYGYQSAVAQLVQSAEDCNPVDVRFENKTFSLIDVSCKTSK